jgi:uncharacterized membrane protein
MITVPQQSRPTRFAAYVSLVLTGAIFGFFYAWVCSTMWGLDAADPRVAIAAMQEMNASVRNAVFFPAFFLTPVALAITAALAWRTRRRAAAYFGIAAAVYLSALILTMAVNVPMNEDLAGVAVPTSIEQARQVWDDYSSRWQTWNIVRTICSGLSLVLAAIGLTALVRRREPAPSAA